MKNKEEEEGERRTGANRGVKLKNVIFYSVNDNELFNNLTNFISNSFG